MPVHTVQALSFVLKSSNSKMVRQPNKVYKQLPGHLRQPLKSIFSSIKHDLAYNHMF